MGNLKPSFHNTKNELNVSDIISHSTNNLYYSPCPSSDIIMPCGPQHTYIEYDSFSSLSGIDQPHNLSYFLWYGGKQYLLKLFLNFIEIGLLWSLQVSITLTMTMTGESDLPCSHVNHELSMLIFNPQAASTSPVSAFPSPHPPLLCNDCISIYFV